MNEKIAEIIIVNWNTCQLLDNCLNSVFRNCNGLLFPYSVTVVDNASTDNSVSMVQNKYKDVKIIRNIKNEGFAKANNRAIKESSAKYLWLLNSDTILNEDVLSLGCKHLEEHENVAIAGCHLVLQDGTRQGGDSGYKPGIKTAFNFAFFLSMIFPDNFRGLFHNGKAVEEFKEVDWVSGAALFVKMEFIKKCGLLTEQFFMYAEDTEFGIRARKNGWSVHYLPNLKVTHLVGASSKNEGISTSSLECIGKLIRNEHSSLYLKVFWLIMFMGYLLRFLCCKILPNENGKKRKMYKEYMKKSFILIFEAKK